MSYLTDAQTIAMLAEAVPLQGFSFQQDGHKLSALAKTLLGQMEGAVMTRQEKINTLYGNLSSLAMIYSWPIDNNDVAMLRGFSQLAVDWPAFLG